MRLLFEIGQHHQVTAETKVLKRDTARAIVMRGENILLLYTKRYDDFSFPGGGLNEGEQKETGLMRELQEETGARDVVVVQPFGYVNELRPHYKPEWDLIHMHSYFYICKIAQDLGSAALEDYELDNGMEVRWVPIHEAIRHNEEIMLASKSSLGLSTNRETLALKIVANELIKPLK